MVGTRFSSDPILGDLVLPAGAFDPERADEIRDLAARAAVYATQARGLGTLRAYRSAWRQYNAWCVRLGLPTPSADPRLVGMYLTVANERLAVATLQVHLAAIVTAHRLVGLSLDPGHPSIALLEQCPIRLHMKPERIPQHRQSCSEVPCST